MAINEVLFRDDSLALQQTEVKTWLETYATDYFDTIEDSTSPYNSVVCKIGDTKALQILFDGTNAYVAYQNNGNDMSGYRGSGSGRLFIKGVSTSKGLCLSYHDSDINVGNAGNICYLIITKDNEDNVVFIRLGAAGSGNNFVLTTCPFSKYNVSTWSDYTSAATLFADNGPLGTSAAMTSLIPFTDKTYPLYTPYAYLLKFNQYRGQEGKFSVDNNLYYTNGYIALAD